MKEKSKKGKSSKRSQIEILAEEAEEPVVRLFAQSIVDIIHPDKEYAFRGESNYFLSSLVFRHTLNQMDPFERIDVLIDLFKILEESTKNLSKEEYDEFCCKLKDLGVDLSIALGSVYKEKDFEVRQKLFDACMNYLNKDASYYYDDVEDIVLDFDDERFFDRLKPFVEKEINRKEKHLVSGRYVACELRILFNAGYCIDLLKEYVQQFGNSVFISNWFIDYYKNQGELDKALEILEKEYEWTGDKSYVKIRINDIIKHFAETDKKNQAIQAYEKQIQQSRHFELDSYRGLKSCFTPKEWNNYREKVFNCKVQSSIAKALYLSEENLLEQLENIVFNPELNIDLFDFNPNKSKSVDVKEILHLSHLKNLIKHLIQTGKKEKALEIYKVLYLQTPNIEADLYKVYKSSFTKNKESSGKSSENISLIGGKPMPNL